MQQRLNLSKGKTRKETKKRGKEVERGDRRGELMANPLWSVITVLIPLAQAINELLQLFTKNDLCISHKRSSSWPTGTVVVTTAIQKTVPL